MDQVTLFGASGPPATFSVGRFVASGPGPPGPEIGSVLAGGRLLLAPARPPPAPGFRPLSGPRGRGGVPLPWVPAFWCSAPYLENSWPARTFFSSAYGRPETRRSAGPAGRSVDPARRGRSVAPRLPSRARIVGPDPAGSPDPGPGPLSFAVVPEKGPLSQMFSWALKVRCNFRAGGLAPPGPPRSRAFLPPFFPLLSAWFRRFLSFLPFSGLVSPRSAIKFLIFIPLFSRFGVRPWHSGRFRGAA